MKFHRTKKNVIEKYGHKFDNPQELARYEELMLRYHAGEITEPEVHPEYPIVINDVYCWTMILDFRYRLINRSQSIPTLGDLVVEDCKPGYWKNKKQTRGGKVVREWKERAVWIEEPYRLKKALVEAQYKIKITEIWH